jgi:hypothetical protein
MWCKLKQRHEFRRGCAIQLNQRLERFKRCAIVNAIRSALQTERFPNTVLRPVGHVENTQLLFLHEWSRLAIGPVRGALRSKKLNERSFSKNTFEFIKSKVSEREARNVQVLEL